MTNEKTKQDVQNDLALSVMKSIQNDDVKMHSHWYFVALSAISVLSLFVTSVLAAIFINLTVNDINYAENQGFRSIAGRNDFLEAFPWLLVIFTGIAVVSTVMLARKLEFAYKYKHHMFFGGTIGLVAALGIGMSVLGLSQHIEDTQPFRPLQTLRSRANDSILFGEVTSIDDDSIVIVTSEDEVIQIEIDDDTQYRMRGEIEVGQELGVFGEQLEDGMWRAFAVGEKPLHARGPRVKGLRDLRSYPGEVKGEQVDRNSGAVNEL